MAVKQQHNNNLLEQILSFLREDLHYKGRQKRKKTASSERVPIHLTRWKIVFCFISDTKKSPEKHLSRSERRKAAIEKTEREKKILPKINLDKYVYL